jgi:hypothetical protein
LNKEYSNTSSSSILQESIVLQEVQSYNVNDDENQIACVCDHDDDTFGWLSKMTNVMYCILQKITILRAVIYRVHLVTPA